MPNPAAISPLRGLSGLSAVALAAAGLALLLARHPLSLGSIFVLGLGLLGVLALALVRFDAAVGLGVLLLAVVRFEPAPTDLVFVVVILLSLCTRRFRFRRVPILVLGLIGAFLTLNLFSSVEMIDVNHGVVFFAITLYLGLFALWLADYVRSPGRAVLVLRLYLFAALISAAVGVAALMVPFPGHEQFLFAGDRAEGLFKDPVVYGPFLVPPALILIEETVTPRLFGWRRSTKVCAVTLLGIAVIVSFSRAAWLNLALGVGTMLAILALRRGGGRRALAVLSVVFAVGAIAFTAVATTGSLGFLEHRAHLQSYDAQRFGAQALGLREGQRYPFGIGPGQFDVVSRVSAHSTYVRAFAEEGMPGLVTLLALLLATFLFAARNAVRGRHTFGIGSAALLGAWVGLLANSLFVDTLHWRHLWVVAALIWAGWMRRDPYAVGSSSSSAVRTGFPR